MLQNNLAKLEVLLRQTVAQLFEVVCIKYLNLAHLEPSILFLDSLLLLFFLELGNEVLAVIT